MEIIKPVTFATGMLLSSDAVETVATWLVGTTYAKDVEVEYSNSIWVSLQAANTGHTPGAAGSETWWIRKSANNKYSMFDDFINTQTSRAGSLTVVIQPGKMVNTAAVLNTAGITSLQVIGNDGVGGPEVFNKTYNFDDTILIDWYMYFFEPYDLKDQFIIRGIPPYTNIVLTFIFTSSSMAQVGNLVFGNIYPLGFTQEGASAGIRDYSVKKVNDYGITTFVQRAFSKRMEATTYVRKGDVNFVQKILTELRAVPIVWIGTQDDAYSTPLIIFGYYRDFTVEISYPSFSLCRLEVEGLV